MSGKAYSGQKDNNAGNTQNSRAFCEGLTVRTDTSGSTIGDNPHESGSEAADAWDRGWTVGQAAAGTTIDPADAPNCAVNVTKTIVA